tara:strand:- start:989 stop:1090 length:102 start_codon:yes stop_codon:yes gene_type:complete
MTDSLASIQGMRDLLLIAINLGILATLIWIGIQ